MIAACVDVSEPHPIELEWAELWRRSVDATPFQSPDWLIPWQRCFGTGASFVITVRDERRLIGLVPCVVEETAQGRTLVLMGGGISDYLDALIEPGRECAALDRVMALLSHHGAQWDVCEWTCLRPESPLLEMGSLPGWADTIAPLDVCPALRLHPGTNGLPESVPPRHRARIEYYRSHAEKAGSMRVESATEQNLDALVGELFRLHALRWRGRGQPGVLDGDVIEAFHREAARRSLRSGMLRLYALRVGADVIAVFYGFTHGKRAYFYLSGFDPEFKNLSPGTLIVAHAIEAAAREGAEEFDFLRGREPYKYWWGAEDRLTYRRALQAPERCRTHEAENRSSRYL